MTHRYPAGEAASGSASHVDSGGRIVSLPPLEISSMSASLASSLLKSWSFWQANSYLVAGVLCLVVVGVLAPALDVRLLQVSDSTGSGNLGAAFVLQCAFVSLAAFLDRALNLTYRDGLARGVPVTRGRAFTHGCIHLAAGVVIALMLQVRFSLPSADIVAQPGFYLVILLLVGSLAFAPPCAFRLFTAKMGSRAVAT